jgi:hypothetical protein
MRSSVSRVVRGLCATAAVGAIVGGTLTLTASAKPAAYAKPSGNPLAKLTADQIAAKAFADMKAASSFRYSGSAKADGQHVSFGLSLTGRGCTGSLGVGNEGSLVIVLIRTTVYAQPDDKFWRTSGVPASEIAQVHGKWLETTGTGSMSLYPAFGQLCSRSKIIGLFTAGKPTGLIKGKTVKIAGHAALQLRGKSGSSPSFYVSVSAKPEIVRISDSDGTINFGNYGARVSLTPPPPGDIISVPGTGSAIRALILPGSRRLFVPYLLGVYGRMGEQRIRWRLVFWAVLRV